VTLLVVVLSAFAVSPTIRAGTLAVIRRIGGIEVEETADYPEMTGPVYRAEGARMTVDEARAQVPFAFGLPEWVPSGYVKGDELTVIAGSRRRPVTTVRAVWLRAGEIALQLEIERRHDGDLPRVVVGDESADMVKVNDAPATLIHGAWHADEGVYKSGHGTSLFWEEDGGLWYILRSWDREVKVGELVRIAESVELPDSE
jgi:hypothetical protein